MGARLRAERKAQKMTLQALSRASGIAVSTLSKAELGQIALSYEKFAALARALRIDMTRLFMPGDASPAQVAPTYVKNSLIEARDYITPNYHHRLLMGEYPGKKMIPIWATITSAKWWNSTTTSATPARNSCWCWPARSASSSRTATAWCWASSNRPTSTAASATCT